MAPQTKRPLTFRQLCAIVRTVILTNPEMDDFTWAEESKCLLLKQGWDYPSPELLRRAMTQVEHALRQTIGVRPVSLPAQADRRPAKDVAKEDRTHHPPGWEIVSSLMAKLSNDSAPSAKRRVGNVVRIRPRETWTISEVEALHEFWQAAQRGSRLSLLQAFAEIAIVRPEDWDPAVARAESQAPGRVVLSSEACFACGDTGRRSLSLREHHIIQLQYGGSDTARNRVLICEACHAAIHPWLPAVPRTTGDWTPLSALVQATAVPEPRRRQAVKGQER